jgi:hypothetical protein
VLGGLLAIWHRRWFGAGLMLTAAVLTRDTTAVVPIAALIAGLGSLVIPWPTEAPTTEDDEPARAPAGGWALALAGGVPLVAFGCWQLLQRARFGSFPLTSSGDNNLSAPLGGLVDQLTKLLPPGGGDEAFRLVSMIGLVALLVAGGWMWWTSRRAPLDTERIAWIGAVLVVVLLNAYLWSGATAFMRAATEAGLLSILLVLRWAKPRLLGLAGLGLAGLWLLTAVAQLSKLG